MWPKYWGYFGEGVDFIEEIVEIFMKEKFFFQFDDGNIVFMETRGKKFDLSLLDIPGECPITEYEYELLLKYYEVAKLKEEYTTKIVFEKIFLREERLHKIREFLCEWYAIFEFAQLINPCGFHSGKVDEITNKYIQSLKNIQQRHNFEFVNDLIPTLKKSIQ